MRAKSRNQPTKGHVNSTYNKQCDTEMTKVYCLRSNRCLRQWYFSGMVRGYEDGYWFGRVGAFGTLLRYGHGWWYDVPTFPAQRTTQRYRYHPPVPLTRPLYPFPFQES